MKSLGYVECNGLSGAIVAADRMLKTADIAKYER
ncbi:BMC domain-containing protein [Limosilactobacillus reuteri]|nr:BMC domain-containing protein [Limosilactobacillus reuteri]MCH5384447.1 BMC domain-containing protein [Limosilactobacillus reuteri]